MKWPWTRRKEPSPELEVARAETERARKKLQDVHRDDTRVSREVNRLAAQARENNFGSDIRRALGLGR